MPAPATTDQLLVNLQKSGLLAPAQLEAALAAAPFDESPIALLERLVHEGLLTRYQAEKLSVGKYKGFVLGPYVIMDRLGGGGMGHVFLAEHSAMRRRVALKVLSVGSANDPVARERFFREARVAAGLDHPHVIRVFDLRREDAISYLVMEFIEGDNLQHIVARNGPLPWHTAVHYARQVASGLQHAHENGLVHRDIKPGNLQLSPDGNVKIIDLGLVRWDVEADSRLTEQVDKSILGTADYLAPEQAVNSSAVDIRADIYSLGATLYFLIAGQPIFPEGKTAQKLMWQQLKDPPSIRAIAPDVPEALAAVIARCLAKSPDDRFATPMELMDALAPWCGDLPAPPKSEWFPSRRRKPGAGLTDSRLTPKRPTLESTMFAPGRSTVAKSSHLFELPPVSVEPRSMEANKMTVADISSETPRRWQAPGHAKASAVVTSHVYLPEAALDREAPRPERPDAPTSPILWVLLGSVLTLVIIGMIVLMRPM